MTTPKCHKCDRDISKPSLVRCREDACPLKSNPAKSSRGVVAGLGGLGMLFLIGFGAYSFVGSGSTSPVDDAESSAVSIGTPRSGANSQSGSGSSWFAKLFSSSSGGSDDASVSSAPRITLPDPRAATRVSTFSCSGHLSSARSLICTNWDLAITDYNLSLLYAQTLRQSKHPGALRTSQDAWQRKLDSLGRDPEVIQKHYNARSESLSDAGGS